MLCGPGNSDSPVQVTSPLFICKMREVDHVMYEKPVLNYVILYHHA